MKKRKGSSNEKMLLKEALDDISKELNKLKREKDILVNKIGSIESQIIESQDRENKLRNQISLLVAEEGQLNKKKSDLQGKMAKIKDKLTKVMRIKDDLRGV